MRLRHGAYLRIALIADLWFYIIVLALFAILPLFPSNSGDNPITFIELAVGLLGVIPFVALIGRVFERPRLPFNEWAYLITASYGILVLFAFFLFGLQDVNVPPHSILIITLVGLSGIAGAIGAHVFDGPTPMGPVIERWIGEEPDNHDARLSS